MRCISPRFRRFFVLILMGVALTCTPGMTTTPAAAREELDVLPARAPRMLYDYLQGSAGPFRATTCRRGRAEDARGRGASAARSEAQVPRGARRLPREDAAQRRASSARGQRDGYRVEKVIYESRPDHHVTANLYLPEGKPPFPGVLVPCGHSANGKAAEAYQRACILMAKNGLAVLCYDPIGQGERVQLLDDDGKPAIAGQHDRAHAWPASAPCSSAGARRPTASGTASAASTTSRAGRRSTRSGSAAPATPAAAR